MAIKKRTPASKKKTGNGTEESGKNKKGLTKGTVLGSSPVFTRAPSVISRMNQNGTVILMKIDRANLFYKIDGVAAEAWTVLDAPRDPGPLAEHLRKRFPAGSRTLARDLDQLLKKFVDYGLVVKAKTPADDRFPALSTRKPKEFGKIQEFDLEKIESEVLNESIYLDVFAGSDLRLKSNVEPIRDALAKVTELDGITHRWKDGDQATHAGLLAQQVALQMPELVRRDRRTQILAVNYQKLNSYLVEAIKDLDRLRRAQEARIRALEARL